MGAEIFCPLSKTAIILHSSIRSLLHQLCLKENISGFSYITMQLLFLISDKSLLFLLKNLTSFQKGGVQIPMQSPKFQPNPSLVNIQPNPPAFGLSDFYWWSPRTQIRAMFPRQGGTWLKGTLKVVVILLAAFVLLDGRGWRPRQRSLGKLMQIILHVHCWWRVWVFRFGWIG